MNAARYCFLLLALLFANMRIFHNERSNQENTIITLCFILPEFCSKVKPQKER